MINCPSVASFSSHIVYRVSIPCLSSFSMIPYRAVSCRIREFHDSRSTIPDTAKLCIVGLSWAIVAALDTRWIRDP